jgi:hypothetical protein
MRGEPIEWHQHAPMGCFLVFLRDGQVQFLSIVLIKFSQTVPIKFLLFPSITYQNPFVLIKFSNGSYQISLVPINNPSKSFCSRQVLKWFQSNSSCSHQQPIKILFVFIKFSNSSNQIPLVPVNNPSKSFCSHQVLK